jgi:hypothetical protein
MSYSGRIRMLEESYRMIEVQISNVEKSENPDQSKLAELHETKNKYLIQLRELRRLQYDESQRVDLSDDR